MPGRNIKSEKHLSNKDHIASCDPESTKDLMLRYYLEEGQPDFTDRLVHGQPVAKRARVKVLKKMMKKIERTLGEPSNKQDSHPQEGMIIVAQVDEATAVQEDEQNRG